MSHTTEHLLASEKLSRMFDTPLKQSGEDEDFWREEKERVDYERMNSYFERERDDGYIRE